MRTGREPIMGLDVVAFRQLRPAPDAALDENGHPVDDEKHWRPGPGMEWSERHFPGRGRGIEPGMTYTFAEQIVFRAGSYAGYNKWREQLARLGNLTRTPPDDIEAPWRPIGGTFWELCDFPDNTGVIGPVVCAKLAKDFRDNHAKAEAINGGFYLIYLDWMDAFELAADGGLSVSSDGTNSSTYEMPSRSNNAWTAAWRRHFRACVNGVESKLGVTNSLKLDRRRPAELVCFTPRKLTELLHRRAQSALCRFCCKMRSVV